MDVAAAPLQPILQGLITIVGGNPVFTGKGASGIFRGAFPGTFLLPLDQGLPGAVGIDPNFARAVITIRGQTTGGLPVTTIDQKAITYVNGFPNPPSPVPLSAVRVALTVDGVGTDPTGSAASGCEIIVWRTN
jgi:hypothetical protein